MRIALALFAVMALLWSGIHAGPSVAHEDDPAHHSVYHADEHEGGEQDAPSGSGKEGQHGCHHHCPQGAGAEAGAAPPSPHIAGALLVPARNLPLASTLRAPLLNPPKT